LLADADEADWNAQFADYGDERAAAGSAIELGDNQASEPDGFMEDASLLD